MAGKRILVLGGGFGGISAALELRRGLGPEHSVALVDHGGTFVMGLRKLWVLVGRGTFAQGTRSLAALAAHGVQVRMATVGAIDIRTREIRTDKGVVPFDYLVVALGAEPRPDLVPGFSDAAFNLYDRGDVERLAQRLRNFSRGRVHVAVAGVPYKCPPAPYEAAMLLDDYFRRRGLREEIEITTSTPQPMSLPVVGAAGCAQVEGLLGGKRIAFTPNRKVVKLDGRTLVADGATVPADLLIVVPPHRPPQPIRESGLALRGDWIAVDTASMRTSVDGVFAVGDVTDVPLANGMALPKAGVFAESQASVAAGGIIAELTGRAAPAAFDGRGYCFIETGGEQAAMVQGEFLAAPAPRVQVAPPSPSAYQEKVEFERARLARWFS